MANKLNTFFVAKSSENAVAIAIAGLSKLVGQTFTTTSVTTDNVVLSIDGTVSAVAQPISAQPLPVQPAIVTS